ncbi:MAG: DNA-processing protein DprA [Candidatus Cloacimonadaceae bacterium]|nr:DNA-processing protein DprA [Candidatus Cloacimonadaceae bacterium]MDP3115004.1 DNA-processing protein DprA [Candidatus Cloacimonadaceae bacterium]
MINHAAYWITIAHLQRWTNGRINALIKAIYFDNNSDLEAFFALETEVWKSVYSLEEHYCASLLEAKEQIANNAFLAESLLNQGFELIPLNDPDYSPTLKENLKLAYSPPVLYIKGNKQLLKEDSIAIVGSRNASAQGMQFTDNVAKRGTDNYQVVVSGFAKGIDKAALDSTLKYNGHSIIVLPQGVLTFGSGYKTYYKQIIEGNVLVLSTFHPKAPWKVELAMARNPIIYGLAKHIYVADSFNSGGTWSGVRDGLRKGRIIYVRKPEEGEANANDLLISMGAREVDFYGELLADQSTAENVSPDNASNEDILDRILYLITDKALTAKEICDKLNCGWTSMRMTKLLKKTDTVEQIKIGRANKYKVKNANDAQQTIDLD